MRTNSSTLLLIDDTPDNLLILSDLFDDVGYRVLVAESGEMGLDCMQQGHPNLVLVDIRMPGIDGFETCRRLKSLKDMHDVPVLLTSAHVAPDTWRDALAAGASDVIAKPFNNLEVLTRVSLHLQLQQLQRAVGLSLPA